MKKFILRAAALLLICLLFSCEFFQDRKKSENEIKSPQINKDSNFVTNPYSELFKPLKPEQKNCGLLLGLNTITGYRTLYISFDNGSVSVKNDFPGIIYPYNDSFIYIKKIQRDSVFGNLHSGWPPKKTIHYWEEIHLSGNKDKVDSLQRNLEKHLRQPFYLYTKENYFEYDSQFIAINYLFGYNICYSFSGKNNFYSATVYNNFSTVFSIDTSIKLLSVKPDGLTFINENNIQKLNPSALHQLMSPNEARILKNKINKELYKKSISNNFSDTIPPPDLLGKLKADTTEIFYTIKREKGIVKLFANAFALTNSVKLSPTYKLRVEFDCGALKQPYITHNSFPIKYDELSVYFHGKINDALVSPYQNYFLILREKTLEVFEVKNGEKLLSYKLPVNCRIIMSEWFSQHHLYKLKNISGI